MIEGTACFQCGSPLQAASEYLAEDMCCSELCVRNLQSRAEERARRWAPRLYRLFISMRRVRAEEDEILDLTRGWRLARLVHHCRGLGVPTDDVQSLLRLTERFARGVPLAIGPHRLIVWCSGRLETGEGDGRPEWRRVHGGWLQRRDDADRGTFVADADLLPVIH